MSRNVRVRFRFVWVTALIVALALMQSVRLHVHVHSHGGAAAVASHHDHQNDFEVPHDVVGDVHFDKADDVDTSPAGALSKLLLGSLLVVAAFALLLFLAPIDTRRDDAWRVPRCIRCHWLPIVFLPPLRAPPV